MIFFKDRNLNSLHLILYFHLLFGAMTHPDRLRRGSISVITRQKMLATLIKFNLAFIFRKKKCHEFCQFAKKYGKWSIFELLVFQSPSPIAIDSYGGQMSDWSLEIEYRHYRMYVNYLRNWLWYFYNRFQTLKDLFPKIF